MKIKQILLPAAMLLMPWLELDGQAPAESPDVHNFTSSTGQIVKARIIAVTRDSVTLQRDGGQAGVVKLAALTQADQDFVKQWAALKNTPGMSANAKVTSSAMNDVAGQPFFGDAPLWDEKPESVAARLRWREESNTKYTGSFRSYPRPDYKLFGAHPFSAALYSEDGKTTSISLVYANKGDLFSGQAKNKDESGSEKAALSKENLAKLDDAITADVQAISDTFTKVLGPAKRERFGDGPARRNVSRWDWKGHAFLLQEVGEAYVSLSINDVAFADAGGKATRVPQAVVRARAKESLEHRPNGDVVITNMPMVDQGPKGYCVPATCERVMRYLGLPADMYVLAMIGKAGFGGGSNPATILEAEKPDLERKGRNFTSWKGPLKIQALAQHLDAGIPVIWGVYMGDEFSAMAFARTDERRKTTDWAAWKTKMHEVAKSAALTPDKTAGHGDLIIGYNKETGEIAISDSWGEHAAERWVTAAEAEQVSQHQFFVISL